MERCKCGRPVRRIIYGESEIAKYDSGDNTEGFSIFKKSMPHRDGLCEHCSDNGYDGLNIGKRGNIIHRDLTDHLEEIKHDYVMSVRG